MSRSGFDLARVAAASLLGLLAVAGSAVASGAERAEIEALKREVAELKRSDAEKQRKLDEMMDLLRDLTARSPDAQRAQAERAPAKGERATPSTPPPLATAPPTAPAEPAPPRGAPPVPAAPSALDRALAEAAPSEAPKSALDRAVEEVAPSGATVAEPAHRPADSTVGKLEIPAGGPAPPTWLARPVPGATLRLLEPSLDVLTVGGWSTADDAEIEQLEGGAHDPKRRGFTFQQAELSLFGAVDPYFNGEAHFVFAEDGVETEEAFATTTSLPWNLQLKAGYFLTSFGRINPVHPHAWPWIDQPVINTRLFGGDGLRSAGVQASWLLPLPFYSELVIGAQNANNGGLTPSFFVPIGDVTVGGRPATTDAVADPADLLYLTRSATSLDVTDQLATLIGFSALFGPNSTGHDERTYVYGTDLTVKWRPADNFRGFPFVVWQSEGMARDFSAAAFTAPPADDTGDAAASTASRTALGFPAAGARAAVGRTTRAAADDGGAVDLPAATLRDWGFYSQLLWGFRYAWMAGVRYEYANSNGGNVPGAPSSLRDARHRVSPLLIYDPTEFSRIRLQYNYDNAPFLEHSQASSVWLGLEILFGTHPAHAY
ncbi:MAG TPA: TonB-dependent receptor [Candidatus Binatia bacterium]|nr:TonB-dependent receptor [Candidatus Binatia bacterium]